MSQVTVALPDGSNRSVPTGTPVRGVAEEISPNLAKAALAGVVDGKLVDLSYPLDHDAAVRIVTDRSPEALPLYRHSTAHLLAAAVTNLFPGAQGWNVKSPSSRPSLRWSRFFASSICVRYAFRSLSEKNAVP